jgi:hypothetical protein
MIEVFHRTTLMADHLGNIRPAAAQSGFALPDLSTPARCKRLRSSQYNQLITADLSQECSNNLCFFNQTLRFSRVRFVFNKGFQTATSNTLILVALQSRLIRMY